jgi:hypothetical protein
MKLHWEILTATAKPLVERIAAHHDLKGFVLAGGTGLALQEGHRSSLDLDFFCVNRDLELPSLGRFRREFLSGSAGEVRSEDRGTLHGTTRGLHVTFLATSYPLMRRPLAAGPLRLARPADVGLMKLAAVVQRGARRDFIDLACILDRHMGLHSLLRLAERKFTDVRDFIPQALRALVYFTDAEDEPDPLRLAPAYAWEKTKRRIELSVRSIADRKFSSRRRRKPVL